MRFPDSALAVAGALLLMLGCGGGDPLPPSPTVIVPPPSSYPVSAYLYSGNTTVLPDSAQEIIRDEATFSRYWREATTALPLPGDIDFTREMVIFVASGTSIPGARVEVDSVAFDRESTGLPDADRRIMRVYVSRVRPCGNSFDGESYPVQFARAPRTDFPVDWHFRENECDNG